MDTQFMRSACMPVDSDLTRHTFSHQSSVYQSKSAPLCLPRALTLKAEGLRGFFSNRERVMCVWPRLQPQLNTTINTAEPLMMRLFTPVIWSVLIVLRPQWIVWMSHTVGRTGQGNRWLVLKSSVTCYVNQETKQDVAWTGLVCKTYFLLSNTN
jgi:hypothetical protein